MDRGWVLGARLGALATSVVVSACAGKGQGSGPAMPPTQVGVVTVTPHTVPVPYQIDGRVEPFRRVEVRSRVDGIIEQRPFTEGSMVHRGQLLYRLDQVRYRAAYEGALATYRNDSLTLRRLSELVPTHAVSQQDVDNARTSADAARAVLDQTKKDLEDTEIRAEIAGRVARTRLELGARVTGPADLLTTIDQLDPIYVSFHPSADQVLDWRSNPRSRALIRPGSELAARAVSPNGSLLPEVGRLDYVAPALDSATGTLEFRARFPNANGLLVPGEFVHLRLEGFTQTEALTVPQRAVQQGLGRQFVYVVGQGDTVSTRDVQPGPWTGDAWIIDKGLSPGDRVIVDGVQKVFPGSVVQPTPDAGSAAAGGGPGSKTPGSARSDTAAGGASAPASPDGGSRP